MKRILQYYLIFGIALVIPRLGSSQNSDNENYWLVGIGINAVDDTGLKLRQYFNVEDNWNIAWYPSRFSGGYFLHNGLGFQLIMSHTTYKKGKTVNALTNTEKRQYFALDAQINYDLNKIFGETGWFDPYVAGGAGHNWVGSTERTTLNAGLGFNTWFNDNLGLNFNALGKFDASGNEEGNNHAQYAIALVYKFHKKKQEPAIEEEITAVAIEEPVEKESTESVSVPEPEISAKQLHMETLAEELQKISPIFFDFDSSYLTGNARESLDKLIDFLNSNNGVGILVISNADSRGTDTYNDWLTQRRAQRVRDYLLKAGIEKTRISTQALGESNLVNECSDNVPCSEEKHQLNRRAEFRLND